MKSRIVIRIGTVIFSGALLIIGMGQGCGKLTALSDSGDSVTNSSGSNDDDPSILPNTGTLALVYGKQVQDQFTNCIGSGLPSERLRTMYESKQGTVSETGYASTVTSPMLMAVTSIAAEVCQDLIIQERTAPRIFIGFNFASTILPADGSLQDAVRRIARSCWSRDEDPEEADLIIESLKTVYPVSSANQTEEAALFMCTSMLSSLDALVL
jgi:hypothetical protein